MNFKLKSTIVRVWRSAIQSVNRPQGRATVSLGNLSSRGDMEANNAPQTVPESTATIATPPIVREVPEIPCSHVIVRIILSWPSRLLNCVVCFSNLGLISS
jgi:hypothetical protein